MFIWHPLTKTLFDWLQTVLFNKIPRWYLCCLKVNWRWQMIVKRLWGEVLSLTLKSQLFFRKGHHVDQGEIADHVKFSSRQYLSNLLWIWTCNPFYKRRSLYDYFSAAIVMLFLTMLHHWFSLVRNWEKAVLFSFRSRNVLGNKHT